ncbi:hypothetical protein HUA74_11790 [Myxococcus sp. CA051A]|uniref:Uncharacterized protein n=1 Tax=Myxococcus llanfairpwllgwyngyllgogerychwyrndrobwllllantysiliogogogochensis TaxID=2590453 RepID=A0A540WXW9_9BACT|nr:MULTISPECIES: hypothetical protein [Myxococcus]NTX05191.1 hypothetical protein [Myxococcus sp. CA040A]NTX09232.1 hypothetical protein [Myxococcus sp. CA056]NTX39753.1 hypothetical protein [Myxococcus sp. CA033]NTX53723.1 hypothetical protein [Myxococcus sp. CA039A]NTX61349.1 hypothetical protein [Myxococcus sp. CA051A]
MAKSPRRLGLVRARGQSMVEYAVVTAALMGFTVMGWPFLVQLLNALQRYFGSIYYVIQSPIP